MTWENDRDHADDRGADATCTDCGRIYVNGPDQTGALCDECADERDRHSSALQIRMAKAALAVPQDVPVVVDVALVPILQPAGYLPWLDALRANAIYGSDALARAWYVSPVPFQLHLITVAPELWGTLKAIARRAA
jgi:hypothetical protein